MSHNTNQTGVILDRNRGFRMWDSSELYDGSETGGRYVPNVNDMVVDWGSNTLYRVDYVDPETLLSTLKPTDLFEKKTYGMSEQDVMLGNVSVGLKDHFRVYVDDSVTPYVVHFDSRLPIGRYDADSSYIKLFHGVNIENPSNVISLRYNNSGVIIGGDIPLVEYPGRPDLKVPATFHTNENLKDGEAVTAVVYNSDGYVTAVVNLTVKKTGFVVKSEISTKHIIDVYIESRYLSKTRERTLEYPVNLPVNTMTYQIMVRYSDGSRRPADMSSGKATLMGIDNYIPSVPGQEVDLVLSYKLSADEISYRSNAGAGEDRYITVPYKAVTMAKDTGYNVKLSVVPVWVSAVDGYRLTYYLHNLTRDTYVDVTNHVQLVTESGGQTYNPVDYMTQQHLVAVIELAEVSPEYKPFRHVQDFTLTLMGQATSVQGAYLIDYEGDGDNVYGEGCYASVHAYADSVMDYVDVSLGLDSVDQWLNKLYYAIDPLLDSAIEGVPPYPTHFYLEYGSQSLKYELLEFTQPRHPGTIAFQDGGTARIRWVKETPTTDLELGVTPLNVRITVEA